MKNIEFNNIKEYRLIKSEELPDIKSQGFLLEHVKSGARIVILQSDDENKVFSAAFRTPPSDSTGVPHIMEHSVLCGSKNFPVKDPFVELAKGSLNTFLNALTFPDKTVYPVASCNDADFRNLMHVYLDAVFYPAIYDHEEIFRQEGWSYSMESEDSPVTVGGVVYNEMKGAFSSPDDIVTRELFNSLYPDVCYGVESGGDPKEIPDLTYEQFLDFHRTYYHPVNSYIYLYGDMDYEDTLHWLDETYLSDFDRISLDSHIDDQKAFDTVLRKRIEYPVSVAEPVENNAYLTWNKVITSRDEKLLQTLDLLDYALFSAPGAPIEKALLEAGIGTEISGCFESDVKQPFFSVMSKNASEHDEDRFVQIIEDTLRSIADNGVDEKALRAGINYNEFRVRESDYGRMPKGLIYNLMSLSTWLYDDSDPFSSFRMLENYSWLKNQIGTGYFEQVIREQFLDNTHGSVLCAVPVRGLAEEREQIQKERLAAFKESLSKDEIRDIVKATSELTKYQETPEKPEDLDKIPVLKREDLRRNIRPLSNNVLKSQDPLFIHHDYETNGIAYIRMIFDMNDLPEGMIPYASLLQNILGVIDTENYSYSDLFNEINLCTGGITLTIDYTENVNDEGTYLGMAVKGKALYDQVPRLLEMIREIIVNSKLEDTDRIREIIMQSISQLQAKFMSAGHQVAVTRASASLSKGSFIKEITEGISFYRFLTDIAEHFDDIKDELVKGLKSLMCHIFTSGSVKISYTGAADKAQDILDLTSDWIEELKTHSLPYEELPKPVKSDEFKLKEGFSSASSVQYVARTGNFKKAGYSYRGAMTVLKTILGYGYLWEKVRVTGKAYGCMSGSNRNGTGFFVSYRDPHLKRTNDVYEAIPEYLEGFDADEKTMIRYIIGTCSETEQPLGAEAMGIRSYAAYLSGITEEMLQKERDDILDCTPDVIRSLAAPVKAVLEAGNMCVIGGEGKLKENREMFDDVSPLI